MPEPEMGNFVCDHASEIVRPKAVVKDDDPVFLLRDARFVVGFAGLASAPSFDAGTWLLQTLAEAAVPECLAGPTIERFKEAARRDVSRLRGVSRVNRRLSFLFTGYTNDQPPRILIWLVSNFERLGEVARPEADDDFDLSGGLPGGPRERVAAIGYVEETGPLADSHLEGIWRLVSEGKPSHAIVGKTLKTLRAVADRSEGAIGKQCTSLVLPSDPTSPPVGDYHSEVIKNERFEPAVVNGPQGWARSEAHLWSPTATLSMPDVGRNDPCPCGSGLKSKRCHGSR